MAKEYYIRPFNNEYQQVPLPLRAYSTGIISIKRDKPASKIGALTPFVELVWGLEGIGELALFGRNFPMEPGDVFYYLPGEDHMQRALSREWRARWLCFDGPLAQAIMLSYGYPRHQRARSKYPEALFREIESLITETGPLDQRRLCGLTQDVLAYAGGMGYPGEHSGKAVKHALEIILANLANPQLGVGLLCRTLEMPASTFSKYFREETGLSPGRYILNRRQEQAQAMLLGTDLSVKKVAERCGFSDPQTFGRFIKRALGKTPRQLRSKRR